MAAAPYTRRIPKRFKKTITFAGAAGTGAVGTVAVGTVTGSVLIVQGAVRCTTLLASAGGGTVSLGTTNNVDGLIAVTTATDIDAAEFWQDATPETEVSPAITNVAVCEDVIINVLVGDVTAGVLEIVFYWLPLSDDGNIA
jgi:hypothetical protein